MHVREKQSKLISTSSLALNVHACLQLRRFGPWSAYLRGAAPRTCRRGPRQSARRLAEAWRRELRAAGAGSFVCLQVRHAAAALSSFSRSLEVRSRPTFTFPSMSKSASDDLAVAHDNLRPACSRACHNCGVCTTQRVRALALRASASNAFTSQCLLEIK